MSGSTPRHAFVAPQLPAVDVGIPVHQEVLDALRAQIPTPRIESMKWVSAVENAYVAVGSPPLSSPPEGWTIFSNILLHIPRDPALLIPRDEALLQ
jgi:hypothetical protein